ncbi:MAG: rplT [Candidatus Peribacteria bacterium]|nr:rplT [Candidatus Peribacteria bacterium]
MRSSTFKKANEAVLKAGLNSYRDRRLKKRTFRALWIVRLNAALRSQGVTYSVFIKAAKDNNLGLNRKVLSEMAIHEPAIFGKILKQVGVV